MICCKLFRVNFFTRFLVVCVGDRILALSQAKELAALGSMDGARVQTVQIFARLLNHFVAALDQSHRKLTQLRLSALFVSTPIENVKTKKRIERASQFVFMFIFGGVFVVISTLYLTLLIHNFAKNILIISSAFFTSSLLSTLLQSCKY